MESRKGALWYVLGAAGLLGGLRLVKEGSSNGWRRPWRDAVLGGFSAGAGLALLSLLEARRLGPLEEGDGERRSFARRLIASIPLRREAAGAGVERP